MATSYFETIMDSWNYWCSFQTIKRNKNTGFESLIDEGVYFPPTPGILRVGERVSYLDSTYDFVEKTAIALKPDLSRFSIDDNPLAVDLMIYFLLVTLNTGYSFISITVKPWANASSGFWDLDTEILYSDIVDFYIPFDLTDATYVPSTYEITNTIQSTSLGSLLKDITNSFIKFTEGESTGFLIAASNGYVDLFGPGYSTKTLRPYIRTVQSISHRQYSFLNINTEITSESKVKGVCRDRNGNILTGERCRIIVYDRKTSEILGKSYSSSADGSFLTTVSEKIGELVNVCFYRNSDKIAGSELMMTVSKNTVGTSISSSSSSLSISSSSESSSSLSESSSSISSSSSSRSSSSSSSSFSSSSSSTSSSSKSSSSSSSEHVY